MGGMTAFPATLLVIAFALITCSSALDVVFVALNQVSHVQHARGLAEEMARRGHNVRFALEEEKRSLLAASEALGVKYLSAGRLPRTEDFYHWSKELPDLLRMANDYSISAWDHLFPALKANPPDLLVFDGLFPIGRALAERLQLPAVELAGGSIFVSLLGAEPAWYPALISGLSVEDLETSFAARLQNSVQRLVLRWGIPLLKAYMYRTFYEHAGINPPLYYAPYGHTRLLLSGSPVGCTPFFHCSFASFYSFSLRSGGPGILFAARRPHWVRLMPLRQEAHVRQTLVPSCPR